MDQAREEDLVVTRMDRGNEERYDDELQSHPDVNKTGAYVRVSTPVV